MSKDAHLTYVHAGVTLRREPVYDVYGPNEGPHLGTVHAVHRQSWVATGPSGEKATGARRWEAATKLWPRG